MKRILLLFTLCIFMLSSCDNDHDNVIYDVDEKESTQLNFTLNVKQTSKNIFERMEFEMNPNAGHSYNELYDTYDSIEWHVDTKGKTKVFEWGHTVYSWSHNFFLPGKFDTFLIGYKNEDKFYSDTTAIEVTNYREFLSYYWSEIKGSIGHGTGYFTMFPNMPRFTTYQDKHDNVPSVTIGIGDEDEIHEHIFLDFMEELYSDPNYTLEDEELLMEKYNELFHYKKDDASPTNMWITSNSRIALLKCHVERYDYTYYEVYAEPNK